MNTLTCWIRSAALCALLALSACGSGDGGDADPGAPPPGPGAGTVVGPAGGTVPGPNGAKLVVPGGALAADTPLTIEQTAAGAPPLPGSFSALGAMFRFSPAGTAFATAVTVTLPFDPAWVPVGGTPALYKTNAQNLWEPVPGAIFGASSVSAPITGFSFAQVVIPPLVSSDPLRVWSFSEYRGDALEEVELASGVQVLGALSATIEFGPTSRDSAFLFDNAQLIPADRSATGHIASSADGVTWWVGAEAPAGNANLPQSPIGNLSQLRQYQTFVKNAADASLKFTFTTAFIEATDFNGALERTCPPAHQQGLRCDLIKGELFVDISAVLAGPPPTLEQPRPFFQLAGGATLGGFAGSWDSSASTARFSRTPLWTVADFDFVIENFNGAPEARVLMKLRSPRTYTVNLSSVPVGGVFTLSIYAHAITYNRLAGPPSEFSSSVAAYLRDPLTVGGATLTISGLTPALTQLPVLGAEVPVQPAACVPGPGPDPAAGVLQFSAGSYRIGEANRTPVVVVTRTGGSRGAVTATVTTSDGSAIAGTDYRAVNGSVFFADGDAAQRVVEVPIIQDLLTAEPDKTVNLRLSQPGGCAALGAQATAVLSIIDDDRPPPPPSFTIGGTVSGLAGSGLVLRAFGATDLTPGNGAFTFNRALTSGTAYSVTVASQPTNPLQICSVGNGTGTVANANVTNVAVTCATPAASGALDATFGSQGKVSTAFGSEGTAMALQSDGKIVMAGGSSSDFVLARYNADGSLDAGFGVAGLVTSDIGSGFADQAHAVALQSDGKIVVVGQAVVGRTARNLFNFDFAVARYNRDGSLDASFGNGGKVTTDFNGVTDRAHAVAIQPDGNIVVVGEVGFDNATGVGTDFGLARYRSDGTLDASFGVGGKLSTDVGGATDVARNVVLLGNGLILVSGPLTLGSDASLGHGGLARFTASGGLDGSFGSGGKVVLQGISVGEGLALQADGKILLVGSLPVGTFPTASRQFALMRLDANGGADNGFGSAGLVTTAFSTQDDFGHAVALQADGKIIVSGQSSNKSNPDFAVARYDTRGVLDGTFGAAGKLSLDFFGSFDGAENVRVQPDGKIVLGGFARNGTRTGYGLVRVNP